MEFGLSSPDPNGRERTSALLKLKGFYSLARRLTRNERTRLLLFGHGEVHVAGVVEDASAVGAKHQFNVRSALEDNLRRQFDVASAAGAVLDSDDGASSFGLAQALVAGKGRLLDRGGECLAAGLQFGQALTQGRLALVEFRELPLSLPPEGFCFPGEGFDLVLGNFGLFHEIELTVFDLEDGSLAGVDLVREGAVLVVLAGLVLLELVLLDLLALADHLELELFPFGFELADSLPGGIGGVSGLFRLGSGQSALGVNGA